MKIQLDIPTKINKKLKKQKIEKDLKNIKQVLLQILEQWDIKEEQIIPATPTP